jgi:hypothetical protein
MGELGWTLDRWQRSTFTEYNYAVAGYWRNWERFAAVPMREVCYTQIAGNPNIKSSAKPSSPQDYMKLSIDGERKKADAPTEEDIQKAKEYAKTLLNGKEKI